MRDRVASPCIRQCCLDDQDICCGCLRSLQEIIDWGNASDDQRRATLARCVRRRKARVQAGFSAR